MKILIAADMEGVTGVVHWEQVMPGEAEYSRFRRLMTQDVNAAVHGALEAGATEVTVTDGHHNGRNILVEELDPHAHLNSGNLDRLSMVEGVDDHVDGVFFVGYHARAGAINGILDHTWSASIVSSLWLNGQPCGETGLNAAVCGHFNVPVLMISGDQTVCAEALAQLGKVETAVVKRAVGRMAAECLAPAAAQEKICEAAVRAVTHLRIGQAPAPYRPAVPLALAIDFNQSEMADKAAIFPGANRTQDRRIEVACPDMLNAYFAFRTLVALAR